MAEDKKDDRPGLNLAKTLKLSEKERGLVNWLRRNPDSNAEEIASNLAMTLEQVELLLEGLVAQGFVKEEINDRDPTLSLYRLILSKRKRSRLDFRSWSGDGGGCLSFGKLSWGESKQNAMAMNPLEVAMVS